MTVYLTGLLISILIATFIKKTIGFNDKKTIKMFISILPLTLISAFRYEVGWDYIKIYTNGFYYVGKYGNEWFSEPVFNYIIHILYDLFKDPLSLFVFMSTMISIVFSMCFKVYGKKEKPCVYIILFVITRYYLCSLNIVRQALAMMIILYSLQYLEKKEFMKYIIGIIMASLFHQMAIIYIPFYFLLNRNLKVKKNLMLLIFGMPIILILIINLIRFTKYSNYFVSMFGNDGSVFFSELLISGLIVFVGLTAYEKISHSDRLIIFFNLSIITTIIALLSFTLPTADRIIWYFSVANIFYIPDLLDCFTSKKLKLLLNFLIYFVLITLFISQTVIGDSYSILPYQNIIEVRRK